MNTTTLDTVVIGAGVAGLHTAQLLASRGVEFEIIDAGDRVGDTWRERYRSLRLFTPRRWAELPGMRLGIGFFEYPTGVGFGDYLERCAVAIGAPIRLSTRVERLSLESDGRFRLALSTGDDIVTTHVAVAAGAHGVPVIPPFAADLDPAIHQVHSLDYRGPEDLEPGAVLVVGAANSGTDIALEAAASGHPTTISGRHPGQIPPDIDTPIGNLMSGLFLRRLRATTIDTERGRAFLAANRGHGVNLVRNKTRDLVRAGIAQVTRVAGVRDGMPLLESGETLDVANVAWCTGSLPDFGWIDVPGVLSADGSVAHRRGMVEAAPGLAFVGLPFQYSVMSPTLVGMRPDAEYVVEHLLAPAPVAQAA
ncbi:flavin-containing monooxygenase [Microbacterium sp. NPDC056044]|uniref:flavin-containing monooxygenase n=1 Tax=Microbacterium sp. NPDC056044 TaxID=3345690 RepID=UPI0035DF5BBE